MAKNLHPRWLGRIDADMTVRLGHHPLRGVLVAASVFIMPGVLTGCFDLGPDGCEDLATPGDYPPLSTTVCAHAKLQVDGKDVSEQGYFGAYYDDSGVDEQRLRVRIDFDHLHLQTLDLEPRTYASSDSEAVLEWWETGSLQSNPECGGEAMITIAGSDGDLVWGDIDATVCDHYGDDEDSLVVQGRFTASLE